MKIINGQIALGLGLVVLSALGYACHYLIFRDAHHLFMFLVGDIAFVFIEVLLVTMILHRLLEVREKRAKLKKLNMVIGSFFSETGTNMLKSLCSFDTNLEATRKALLVTESWKGADFAKTKKGAEKTAYRMDATLGDLMALRYLLAEKRGHLLRILENPNILEHESFSDLLWAVFHLGDELNHRKSLSDLSDNDLQHIGGDLSRAYTVLICEWLSYMRHLKEDYPYLFSLARRLNPFDPQAEAEIG